jgi:hypothetical protein
MNVLSKKTMLSAALGAVIAGVLVAPAPAAGQVEITPALGLGKFSGEGSDGFNAGPELGVSVAGRLHPQFSLAALLVYDRLSVEDVPSFADVSAWMVGVQLIPAFHFIQGALDVSLGPTLGLFRFSITADIPGNLDPAVTVRGFQVGGRIAAMLAVNPRVSVGPYFSYARMFATNACAEMGGVEDCNDDPDSDDEGFWSLGFGVRF